MPIPTISWDAVLPAALAGTRRQAPPALPGLTPTLGTEANATEKQLLLTAANVALVQQAGQRPQPGPAAAPAPAPREPRRRAGPASAQLFEEVLARGDQQAYAYCLAALDLHNRCLPPKLLLSALTFLHRKAYAERYAPLREPFIWLLFLHARAFGARGIWLVDILCEHYPALNSAHSMAQGAFAQLAQTPFCRYQYWAEILTRRTALARQHLTREWPYETAEFRQGVLWYLWATGREVNLPSLYKAQLDELTTQQVPPAWVAVYQDAKSLARAPGSALAERLWSRAQQWLVYVPPTADHPGQLRTTFPHVWEPAWQDTDGIQEWPDQTQPKYPGGKGGSWLAQHLALLPPSRWAAARGLTLSELITLAERADQSTLLLLAWLQAAVNTRDLPAARALLDHLATHRSHSWFEVLVPAVVRLLPPAEQRAWLRRVVPARLSAPASAHWASWLDALHPELPGSLAEALPIIAALLDRVPEPSSNHPVSKLLPLLSKLPYRGEDGLRPAVLAALGPLQERHPALAPLIGSVLATLAWRADFVAGLAGLPPLPATMPTSS